MVSSRLRLRMAPRPSAPIWSIVAVDPTITMGDDAQWTITRDMRGRVSTATSIYVRIMNATELAVGPGEIAGFPGDFTEAFDIQMQALADADPDVICTGEFSTIRLEFLATWDNSFTVSRTTVNQVGRGALRCGLVIYQPAGGTIISDSAAIDIDEVVPTADEAPVCTVQPAISGSGQQGSQLTSTYGTWTGVPAVTQAMLAGQWYRGASTLIAGATSPQYTSVVADTTAGSVFFRVTANNGVGGNVIANSAPITITANQTAPVFTAIPTISGPNPPQVGLSMQSQLGVATGNPPPTITEVWQVAQVDTADTDSSYTPVTGNIGSSLRKKNVATNGVGSPATAFSIATANVIPAPTGDLTGVVLSTPFVLWMGAEDTTIGTFAGQGGTIAGLSFASGGNAGGRVKITGTSPNFTLKIGSVAPNFGTSLTLPAGSNPRPYPTSEYTITTVANPGAIQNTHTLLAKYPPIAPTGGGASPTVVTVTTLAGARAEFQAETTDPRKLVINPNVPVVMESNSGNMGVIGGPVLGELKSNFDFVGHRRAIIAKDGQLEVWQAENARFYNLNFRPGGDKVGQTFENRDCLVILHGKDLLFSNCTFAWSIDELMSVIRHTGNPGPAPQGFRFPFRIKFYRCLFAEALYQAGHTEGSHNFGALAYAGSSQIIFDQCTFLGLGQRNPVFDVGSGMGYVCQNCLVVNWGTGGGYGGTGLGNTFSQFADLKSTAIIRANLYRPIVNDANARSRAIMIHNKVTTGSYLYVAPKTGPDANHFIQKSGSSAPDFASDPVDPALMMVRNNATLQCIVSTPRFQLVDNTYLPTATAQNRADLYALLAGRTTCVVGVREFDNGNPLTGNPVPGFLAMGQNDYETMDRWDSTSGMFRAKGGFDPYTAFQYTNAELMALHDASKINFTYKTGIPPNNT